MHYFLKLLLEELTWELSETVEFLFLNFLVFFLVLFLIVHSRSLYRAPQTHMLRTSPAKTTVAPRHPPYSLTSVSVKGAIRKVPTPLPQTDNPVAKERLKLNLIEV